MSQQTTPYKASSHTGADLPTGVCLPDVLPNGRNVIMAINTWTILLIRYTAGVVKWAQAEIKALDVSTRKLLALYKCFSINDDVYRLYVT